MFQKQIQYINWKIDYFQKIFPNNTRFQISNFILYLKESNFPSNSFIWKEGDEADFFFIIIEYYLINIIFKEG